MYLSSIKLSFLPVSNSTHYYNRERWVQKTSKQIMNSARKQHRHENLTIPSCFGSSSSSPSTSWSRHAHGEGREEEERENIKERLKVKKPQYGGPTVIPSKLNAYREKKILDNKEGQLTTTITLHSPDDLRRSTKQQDPGSDSGFISERGLQKLTKSHHKECTHTKRRGHHINSTSTTTDNTDVGYSSSSAVTCIPRRKTNNTKLGPCQKISNVVKEYKPGRELELYLTIVTLCRKYLETLLKEKDRERVTRVYLKALELLFKKYYWINVDKSSGFTTLPTRISEVLSEEISQPSISNSTITKVRRFNSIMDFGNLSLPALVNFLHDLRNKIKIMKTKKQEIRKLLKCNTKEKTDLKFTCSAITSELQILQKQYEEARQHAKRKYKLHFNDSRISSLHRIREKQREGHLGSNLSEYFQRNNSLNGCVVNTCLLNALAEDLQMKMQDESSIGEKYQKSSKHCSDDKTPKSVLVNGDEEDNSVESFERNERWARLGYFHSSDHLHPSFSPDTHENLSNSNQNKVVQQNSSSSEQDNCIYTKYEFKQPPDKFKILYTSSELKDEQTKIRNWRETEMRNWRETEMHNWRENVMRDWRETESRDWQEKAKGSPRYARNSFVNDNKQFIKCSNTTKECQHDHGKKDIHDEELQKKETINFNNILCKRNINNSKDTQENIKKEGEITDENNDFKTDNTRAILRNKANYDPDRNYWYRSPQEAKELIKQEDKSSTKFDFVDEVVSQNPISTTTCQAVVKRQDTLISKNINSNTPESEEPVTISRENGISPESDVVDGSISQHRVSTQPAAVKRQDIFIVKNGNSNTQQPRKPVTISPEDGTSIKFDVVDWNVLQCNASAHQAVVSRQEVATSVGESNKNNNSIITDNGNEDKTLALDGDIKREENGSKIKSIKDETIKGKHRNDDWKSNMQETKAVSMNMDAVKKSYKIIEEKYQSKVKPKPCKQTESILNGKHQIHSKQRDDGTSFRISKPDPIDSTDRNSLTKTNKKLTKGRYTAKLRDATAWNDDTALNDVTTFISQSNDSIGVINTAAEDIYYISPKDLQRQNTIVKESIVKQNYGDENFVEHDVCEDEEVIKKTIEGLQSRATEDLWSIANTNLQLTPNPKLRSKGETRQQFIADSVKWSEENKLPENPKPSNRKNDKVLEHKTTQTDEDLTTRSIGVGTNDPKEEFSKQQKTILWDGLKRNYDHFKLRDSKKPKECSGDTIHRETKCGELDNPHLANKPAEYSDGKTTSQNQISVQLQRIKRETHQPLVEELGTTENQLEEISCRFDGENEPVIQNYHYDNYARNDRNNYDNYVNLEDFLEFLDPKKNIFLEEYDDTQGFNEAALVSTFDVVDSIGSSKAVSIELDEKHSKSIKEITAVTGAAPIDQGKNVGFNQIASALQRSTSSLKDHSTAVSVQLDDQNNDENFESDDNTKIFSNQDCFMEMLDPRKNVFLQEYDETKSMKKAMRTTALDAIDYSKGVTVTLTRYKQSTTKMEPRYKGRVEPHSKGRTDEEKGIEKTHNKNDKVEDTSYKINAQELEFQETMFDDSMMESLENNFIEIKGENSTSNPPTKQTSSTTVKKLSKNPFLNDEPVVQRKDIMHEIYEKSRTVSFSDSEPSQPDDDGDNDDDEKEKQHSFISKEVLFDCRNLEEHPLESLQSAPNYSDIHYTTNEEYNKQKETKKEMQTEEILQHHQQQQHQQQRKQLQNQGDGEHEQQQWRQNQHQDNTKKSMNKSLELIETKLEEDKIPDVPSFQSKHSKPIDDLVAIYCYDSSTTKPSESVPLDIDLFDALSSTAIDRQDSQRESNDGNCNQRESDGENCSQKECYGENITAPIDAFIKEEETKSTQFQSNKESSLNPFHISYDSNTHEFRGDKYIRNKEVVYTDEIEKVKGHKTDTSNPFFMSETIDDQFTFESLLLPKRRESEQQNKGIYCLEPSLFSLQVKRKNCKEQDRDSTQDSDNTKYATDSCTPNNYLESKIPDCGNIRLKWATISLQADRNNAKLILPSVMYKSGDAVQPNKALITYKDSQDGRLEESLFLLYAENSQECSIFEKNLNRTFAEEDNEENGPKESCEADWEVIKNEFGDLQDNCKEFQGECTERIEIQEKATTSDLNRCEVIAPLTAPPYSIDGTYMKDCHPHHDTNGYHKSESEKRDQQKLEDEELMESFSDSIEHGSTMTTALPTTSTQRGTVSPSTKRNQFTDMGENLVETFDQTNNLVANVSSKNKNVQKSDKTTVKDNGRNGDDYDDDDGVDNSDSDGKNDLDLLLLQENLLCSKLSNSEDEELTCTGDTGIWSNNGSVKLNGNEYATYKTSSGFQGKRLYTEVSYDNGEVLIVDPGSGTIKAGLSMQEKPIHIPSIVGTPSYQKVFPCEADTISDWMVGFNAANHRGVLKLKYPIQYGTVEDWMGFEKLLDYTLHDRLNINSSEHPLIITERVFAPKLSRERMMEIMFESHDVPAYYVAMQGVMTLYSYGMTTGTVLDIGESVSQVVPVYDGYSIGHATDSMKLGGRDITEYLQLLITKQGKTMKTTAEYEIVKELKEALCFIQNESGEYEERIGSSSSADYELPDGHCITIGPERQSAPELLFDPLILGKEQSGIQHMVCNGIQKCDMDLRKDLYSNIVLAGGSTLLPGLTQRLSTEMKGLVDPLTSNMIRIRKNEQGVDSVWKGASILSSLSSFQNMWITKEEFDEYGSNIVHIKCF